MDEEQPGLSSQNTSFIVFMVAAILLIFGPIQPYGMVIRTAYLILIPALVWFVLHHWGKRWPIDPSMNDRISRSLWSMVAGAFLVGSYLSYTKKYHTECDQEIQTRDGSECVGDYVTVKGGDKEAAFLLVFAAGIMIWAAVAKRAQ